MECTQAEAFEQYIRDLRVVRSISRPTIQFVLEPDSLRKRVRVRFLFIGGFAERVRRAVNEQRQDITIRVVSCLLLVWEFRLVRKFLVYVEKPFFL